MHDDAKKLKLLLDAKLQQFLADQFSTHREIIKNESVLTILDHLSEVSAGGKRLRPFIIFTLYKHTHPEATPEDIIEILLAVELFHIFCLIHDDVMDEAPTRHGVATLHDFASTTVYAKSTKPQTVRRAGESQAILVGDLVFNMVHKLLTRTRERDLSHTKETLMVFDTLIDEVCLGQMLDIDLTTKSTATTVEVVAKNRLKTARYSFARPLQIGAHLASRADLIDFTLAFGEVVGLLYQIQDDLLDVIGDEVKIKKETFQDVTQNQHTMMTTFMRTQGGATLDVLDSKVGQTLSLSDKAALRAAFEESGAIIYARGLIKEHEQTAHDLMTEHQLNEKDTALFTKMLMLLSGRES